MTMRSLLRITLLTVILGSGTSVLGQKGDQPPGKHSEADRAALQKEFLKLRFGLFLHFNMATYVDREWANGYEDPTIFKPDRLYCRQWAEVASAAGMKYGVLTVKHTGGWCLWDSDHTTHDIAGFVNYKNGKGDIVQEFVDAFRAHGLRVGFYYCFPGDFSNPRHGNPVPEGKPDLHGLPPEAAGDYVGFIKRQLTELLTNYGAVDLLWIDQYSNKYTGSCWQEIRAHVKSLQPECIVIGNNARNLNDSDVYSCEFPWDPKGMPPVGNTMPAEVCDKISRTWFWNTADRPEDVRDAKEIVKMLKLCNERNANYLLNVPPGRDGLISGTHLERMREVAALVLAEGEFESRRKAENKALPVKGYELFWSDEFESDALDFKKWDYRSLGQPVGNPNKAGTEIDIFEYLRNRGDKIQHTLHWDGYGKSHKSAQKIAEVPNLNQGWHTVGFLWTPTQYVFYVDGKETWRTDQGVSHRPQYTILSLEVGKWAGTTQSLPDEFSYAFIVHHFTKSQYDRALWLQYFTGDSLYYTSF